MSDMYMDATKPCPKCGAERWAGDPHVCPPEQPQIHASLNFDSLRIVSRDRCRRWHPGGMDEWSVSDWAVAMLGEAGEACNAIKKLRRIETGALNINDPGRQLTERNTAIAAIGEELADTMIYLDLLAQRLGINLADEVVKKFNATSARYGFPERL